MSKAFLRLDIYKLYFVTAKNDPPDRFLNAASSPLYEVLHKAKGHLLVSFCFMETRGLFLIFAKHKCRFHSWCFAKIFGHR